MSNSGYIFAKEIDLNSENWQFIWQQEKKYRQWKWFHNVFKNRQYYITRLKAVTGVEKTTGQDSQFKAKIKEQSVVFKSAFLNELSNSNLKSLVGFQIVQNFQYDAGKIWFLDVEDVQLNQKPEHSKHYTYYEHYYELIMNLLWTFKTLARYSTFNQTINEKRLQSLCYRIIKIDSQVDMLEPDKQYSYSVSVLGANLTRRNCFRAAAQLIVFDNATSLMYFYYHQKFVEWSHCK